MFGKISCAAGLALALLIPGGTARACEGADCPAPAESVSKPLDIQKFMREQAASTRVGERPAHRSSHTAAKSKPDTAKRAAHRTVAARPKPEQKKPARQERARQESAPLPTAAAASFASQGKPAVPVVASGEFNAIDGATSPFPETTGAAPAAEPNVHLVAAAEVNELDRKADNASPFPEPPAAAAPAKVETAPAAQGSWLHWLWSVVTGTFAALATAVRQLVHL